MPVVQIRALPQPRCIADRSVTGQSPITRSRPALELQGPEGIWLSLASDGG
jgi:hypothetical protein